MDYKPNLGYSFSDGFLVDNVSELLTRLVNSSFPNNWVSRDLAVGAMVAVVHGRSVGQSNGAGKWIGRSEMFGD